jgi:hypothetical protein
MPQWFRIIRLWFPIAVALTAAMGVTYLGLQQGYRTGLDDPQVQLTQDGASRLDAGAPAASLTGSGTVDAACSLAPFVIVFGRDDRPVSSSALLDGAVPVPPAGVLDAARTHGQNRVTWQPRKGVRIATVSAAAKDGRVVLAGRNMREVEGRIDRLGQLVAGAWLLAMGATFTAVLLVGLLGSRLWPRHR